MRKAQSKRIRTAAARVERVKRLKRRAAVLKIGRAGLNPAMLYAAGAFGVSEGKLAQMRRIAGACTRSTVKGASLALDLELAGGSRNALDPAYEAAAAPIVAWARAVWQGRQSRATMYQALASQRARVNAWKHVCGPAGAVLLTYKRLGWAISTPKTLHVGGERSIDLEDTPPCRVRELVHDAVQREAHRKIAASNGWTELEAGINTADVRAALQG